MLRARCCAFSCFAPQADSLQPRQSLDPRARGTASCGSRCALREVCATRGELRRASLSSAAMPASTIVVVAPRRARSPAGAEYRDRYRRAPCRDTQHPIPLACVGTALAARAVRLWAATARVAHGPGRLAYCDRGRHLLSGDDGAVLQVPVSSAMRIPPGGTQSVPKQRCRRRRAGSRHAFCVSLSACYSTEDGWFSPPALASRPWLRAPCYGARGGSSSRARRCSLPAARAAWD